MSYGELVAACYGIALVAITAYLANQSRVTIARLKAVTGSHANISKYRRTMLVPRILVTLQFTIVAGSILALLASGAKWVIS